MVSQFRSSDPTLCEQSVEHDHLHEYYPAEGITADSIETLLLGFGVLEHRHWHNTTGRRSNAPKEVKCASHNKLYIDSKHTHTHPSFSMVLEEGGIFKELERLTPPAGHILMLLEYRRRQNIKNVTLSQSSLHICDYLDTVERVGRALECLLNDTL